MLVTFLTEMVPQLCMQYVCLSRYLSWLLVMDCWGYKFRNPIINPRFIYRNLPFSELILSHFETQIGWCPYCCFFKNHIILYAAKTFVLKHFLREWYTIISEVFSHMVNTHSRILMLAIYYLYKHKKISFYFWIVENVNNFCLKWTKSFW